jgi:hypothetical protein
MSIKTDREAMTLAECGRKMRVSWKTVKDWIDAGHLQAFIRPGAELGSKTRGPKGLRVMPDDWDRFVRAQTVTGRTAPEPSPTTQPQAPRSLPAGLDGVRRSRRHRTG